MSNFKELTKRPDTGIIQEAEWLDNYFGRHRYGVRFPDGSLWRVDGFRPAEPILTRVNEAEK